MSLGAKDYCYFGVCVENCIKHLMARRTLKGGVFYLAVFFRDNAFFNKFEEHRGPSGGAAPGVQRYFLRLRSHAMPCYWLKIQLEENNEHKIEIITKGNK
jgi:hypothetical protein